MKALSDYNLKLLQHTFQSWCAVPHNAQKLLREFYALAGEIDAASLRLGKAVEERLGTEWALLRSQVARSHQSADGTIKLLVDFAGSGTVEAVLMPSHRADRSAGCVSSQIGCAMGCDFCASTRSGLVRNLSAGEIVEQFVHLKRRSLEQSRKLRSLVFMGMGEPMHNLDAVLEAIPRIADSTMGNLGYRNITVSTVGVVEGIEQLTRADLGVQLAVSLHAPDDETRCRIVPTGRKWRVAEIIRAARDFHEHADRYVTIEYCMLAGVNDSDQQARLLASLLAGFRAHVNLIPYNSIGPGLSGTVFERPPQERMDRFAELLTAGGAIAHFRQTRGDDVAAACGQLAGAKCE